MDTSSEDPLPAPGSARLLATPPAILLFDLDGTLVDSRAAYARSMNHALASVGLEPRPEAELHGYLGPPIHETLLDLMRVPPALVDPIIASYRERYAARSVIESRVFDGVAELLGTLSGRVRLAVATSKPLDAALRLLDGLGIASVFETISGPAAEAVNESKAVTIGRALSSLERTTPTPGTQPATAGDGAPRSGTPVMIGDRRYDVLGAAAHGLPTIGVLWGAGSEAELRAAGAAALAAAPHEIPALLGLE